jgi:glycosyltransferase involved in cell wall biosynthesis
MSLLPFFIIVKCLRNNYSVYHFHDPELIPLGIILRIFFKKVIYDVHEDIAKDVFDKPYLPIWSKSFISLFVNYFEKIGVLFFNHIIAATNSISEKFPSNKTTLIRNVPFLSELVAKKPTAYEERPRNIIYMGGMADFNGVYEILLALENIPDDSGIRLILGGKFINEKQKLLFTKMNAWSKVDYYGWVDREKLSYLYSQARLGLVLYKPTPNIMECEPNKFFEVLSAGIPLLCTNLPRWNNFVNQNKCGETVDPSDSVKVANSIEQLTDINTKYIEMAINARNIIEKEYNWELESIKLVKLYNKITS